MIMLSQFQMDGRCCVFTYLEDFKQNPTGAKPYLAVSMFDELVTNHNAVYVRGEFSVQHLAKQVRSVVVVVHSVYSSHFLIGS